MVHRSLALALGSALLCACGTSVSLSGDDAPSPGPPRAGGATAGPVPTAVPGRTGAPAPRPSKRSLARPSGGDRVQRRPPDEPRRPARQRPVLDDWVVGARPLPLRPDGFGRVLPTPPQLRVRRMPTRDVLAPPSSGRFERRIGPVTPDIRRRMGRTWTPRCPVPLDRLRYVTVSFWGFDRRPHTGELVLHADVAADVAGVFRRLFRARYPIERMRLVTGRDLHQPPTGDGNNTAALVCRRVRQQDEWSEHAYGLAVDVNPFLNPYRSDDLVLPELASAYLDRDWRRPGMIHPGGVVVDAFESIGWTWGGDFESLEDYMHFSATGG